MLVNAKCLYSYCIIIATIAPIIWGQQVAKKRCSEYTQIARALTIDRDIDDIKCCEYGNDDYESPHMATLGFGHRDEYIWLCGGAIISERFVITAAHCTNHPELGIVKAVRVGSRKQPRGILGLVMRISRVIEHPDYDQPSKYNDLALLKLKKRLRFSEAILPACLNTQFDIRPRTHKLISSIYDEEEEDVREIELDLYTDGMCKNKYEEYSHQELPEGIKTSIQICAGMGSEARVCQGESGGPLSMKIGQIHTLVGITTLDTSCRFARTPEVYARISSFVPWIEKQVWG